jgi:hypothetical protein
MAVVAVCQTWALPVLGWPGPSGGLLKMEWGSQGSLPTVLPRSGRDCDSGRFSLGYGIRGSSVWQSSGVGPSSTSCIDASSCLPWSWFGSSDRRGGSKGSELGF